MEPSRVTQRRQTMAGRSKISKKMAHRGRSAAFPEGARDAGSQPFQLHGIQGNWFQVFTGEREESDQWHTLQNRMMTASRPHPSPTGHSNNLHNPTQYSCHGGLGPPPPLPPLCLTQQGRKCSLVLFRAAFCTRMSRGPTRRMFWIFARVGKGHARIQIGKKTFSISYALPTW